MDASDMGTDNGHHKFAVIHQSYLKFTNCFKLVPRELNVISMLVRMARFNNWCLIMQITLLFYNIVEPIGALNDRLQPRRRQSQATLLSHKQNLLTGSANSPLTSPYNQFYLTNNVNSPHNGKRTFDFNLLMDVIG